MASTGSRSNAKSVSAVNRLSTRIRLVRPVEQNNWVSSSNSLHQHEFGCLNVGGGYDDNFGDPFFVGLGEEPSSDFRDSSSIFR